MPILKLTVTDDEMELLKKWANGSALATLAKHAVLLKAANDLSTLLVPLRYPSGTLAVPSTLQVPIKGTASTRSKPGTNCALQFTSEKNINIDTERTEAAQRIIGYYNQICGGQVAILDQSAIGIISEKLEAYTEEDAQGVIEWGNRCWPPGDEWRPKCLTITHLFGKKFGDYLTAPRQTTSVAVAGDELDWFDGEGP